MEMANMPDMFSWEANMREETVNYRFALAKHCGIPVSLWYLY